MLIRFGDCLGGGFGGTFDWCSLDGWLGINLCDRLWSENSHCNHKKFSKDQNLIYFVCSIQMLSSKLTFMAEKPGLVGH